MTGFNLLDLNPSASHMQSWASGFISLSPHRCIPSSRWPPGCHRAPAATHPCTAVWRTERRATLQHSWGTRRSSTESGLQAPSARRPVTVTVGTVWRLQLDPPPPKPQRLTVAATVGAVVVILARTIIGVVYFKDCPQQPNIPNYLLGLAFMPLMMVPFVTLPCERDAAQPHQHPGVFKACLHFLAGLFILTWILAGNIWVFSVYQPNYDPAAADGLYCNKTLYTFAFWNAVWETFVMFSLLAKLCKGLLCYVIMSPAPTHRDFYGNV